MSEIASLRERSPVLDELLRVGEARLRDKYGARLCGLVLHGSEARGEAEEDSDVDLLVLLEGPVELGIELRTIIDILYPLQIELGFFRPLEIIPTDVADYEAQGYALYRHAREDGIRL
jgi:predicted nucleotidyltransferase